MGDGDMLSILHSMVDEDGKTHDEFQRLRFSQRMAIIEVLAEVERLRAALTRIIERYDQTQAGSHGDEALLPLDHWNLPRAMQQEARDALGLPAMSEETTHGN